MANTKFNTRLQLKGGTYAEWTAANPTPLENELCVVVIPAETGAVVQEPTVLFKVGDGTTAFNSLKFTGALAADVHTWAKAANKPEYAASEITGLAEYISGKVEDTDTQYKIVKASDTTYKLQSKSLNGEWADVADSIIDLSTMAGDIASLKELVGTTAVATQISNAIDALDLANTYVAKESGKSLVSNTEIAKLATVSEGANKVEASDTNGKIKIDGVDTIVYTHPANHTIAEVSGLQDALDGKQPVGDYATKTEAQGYADAKDSAIAEAKKAGTDAQADVDALEVRVKANEDAIGVLNGTGEGSVNKTVTDAINDFAAKVSDDGTVNTYKELIDYAAEHGAEFTELVGEVAANTAAIETLEGEMDAVQEEVAKKANDTDLAAIAKTGNVNDLIQTTGDVIIFNCGGPKIGTADEYPTA